MNSKGIERLPQIKKTSEAIDRPFASTGLQDVSARWFDAPPWSTIPLAVRIMAQFNCGRLLGMHPLRSFP